MKPRWAKPRPSSAEKWLFTAIFSGVTQGACDSSWGKAPRKSRSKGIALKSGRTIAKGIKTVKKILLAKTTQRLPR
jgi:hypothetical protein